MLDKVGAFLNSDNQREFTFFVDVNPGRRTLNNNNTMELTDTHSKNLSVDYSSIVVYKIPEGETIASGQELVNQTFDNNWIIPEGEVTWNFTGRDGVFTIPDSTHYVIRYNALVLGNGEQTFKNEAEMKGYRSKKEDAKTYSGDVISGADICQIKLLKHEKGMTSKGLGGAVFQLFRGTGNYDPDTGEEIKEPMTWGKTWTSAAADDPSEGDGAGSGGVNTGGTEGEVITFTTDGNGYCLIALNQSVHGAELEEGVHYYLKEIDSPDGYTIDNSVEYWAFTLTKDADQVNYGGTNEDGKRQWIYYYYNDIMKIANSPTPTTVSVTKVWKDKNDNKVSWDQDVDSINLTLIRMKGETQDMEFGESGVMTLVVTATGISRISPELDGVTGSVALKTEGTPSDGYLVTLEGLPLTYDQEGTTHDYTYCFSEDQVANYNAPVYKLSSGGNVNDRVASGGSIENSPEEAYRLPATGGMGSWGFYLSGGLLVLAVGMILARRQRRLRL